MNNLRNCYRPAFIMLLIFFFVDASAQDSTAGLNLMSSFSSYRKAVMSDSNRRMVEIRQYLPRIVYDLRYATKNNFMQRQMYPARTNKTYLRLPALRALQKVEAELSQQGYGLKIFDAYRPYAVTVKFWELVKDERYVANPAKGSGHNRGVAIDLTIINKQTGEELDMGTGFDNFTDTAHHSFTQLPAQVLANRKKLKDLMEKAGFKSLESEWWHYSLPDAKKYEVLDLSFKQLKKPL